MKVFVIVRYGIYMQGIFGVYSTKDEALIAARLYISNEYDDYHAFEVIEYEMDKIYDEDFKHKEVFLLERNGKEITVKEL